MRRVTNAIMFAAIVLSGPARADDDTCSGNLTQECVFDLAIRLADDEQFNIMFAHDLVAITNMRIRADPASLSAAIDTFETEMIRRESDPYRRELQVGNAACAPFSRQSDLHGVPQMAEYFAARLLKIDESVEPAIENAYPGYGNLRFRALACFSELGDLPAIISFLNTNRRGDDLIKGVADRLVAAGHVSEAKELVARFAPDLSGTPISKTVISAALRNRDFDMALDEALRIDDIDARLAAFRLIILYANGEGKFDTATGIVSRVKTEAGGVLPVDFAMSAASVFGRLGDWSMVDDALAKVEKGSRRRMAALELSIIHAMNSGDDEAVLAYIEAASDVRSVELALAKATSAALHNGRQDFDNLLLSLPEHARFEVLEVIGTWSVANGDIATGRAILNRLVAEGAKRRHTGWLRSRLAIQLAEKGLFTEAVEHAEIYGQGPVMARIALRMK